MTDSALDRLTENINGDGPIDPAEQRDLVRDVMARRIRWQCPNCLHSYREAYCDGCGRMLSVAHLVKGAE